MIIVSLVILSNTNSEAIYKMNLNCINSFVLSALKAKFSFEIILVESNTQASYFYDFSHFKVLKPNQTFGFHKFANIGLREAKGDYFVFSNNDVIFDENCLQECFKIIDKHKNIKSFSPYDVRSNKLSKVEINTKSHVLGFEIQKHITGWCIIMYKEVYETIKKLDERFDFYYADNDYAMQLHKYNIKHALVTKAIAHHLCGQSSVVDKKKISFDLPLKTPKYIIKENWTWVLSNKKMIEGLIVFHNKWGSRRLIKIKLFLAKILSNFGLGYLNRYLV